MASLDRLLGAIPLWGVLVGTLVLVLVSVEGGYRWAGRRQRERDREPEKEAPVGTMMGATMGMLALLLAFTFGMAADAFNARKVALVNEANAIRVTYLLSGTVPESLRSEIRTVLREYVDERLRWADGQPDEPGRSAKDLLDRFWKAATAAAVQGPGNVDVFLEYAGRITELGQERHLVRERSRIPGPVWLILYGVAVLGLTATGYHSGVAGTSRNPVMLAVAIAFSVVIVVIADLNRPGEGLINVSQQPMVELREIMATSTP